MFYIHQTTCISPQRSFGEIKIDELRESVGNKLTVIEPSYSGISPAVLRRMGKSARMGAGAAQPLFKPAAAANGIIIGSGNGGMEESVKFLKQIIEYDEGMLTPGSFVQSTSNAIASQAALSTGNKGYNITHVHRGLAFENAVIDAGLMIKENPSHTYLLGGVDEISAYNYNLESLEGWYKKEEVSNRQLYEGNSAGSIAGEGAAMFLVNGNGTNALAQVRAVLTLHSREEKDVLNMLQHFLNTHLPPGEKIGLLISGENGDNRFLHFYAGCEGLAGSDATVVRYKHMSGEYPTASACALWLACTVPFLPLPPHHMIKKGSSKNGKNGKGGNKHTLIYNNHKGSQHSLMLVSGEGS